MNNIIKAISFGLFPKKEKTENDRNYGLLSEWILFKPLNNIMKVV